MSTGKGKMIQKYNRFIFYQEVFCSVCHLYTHKYVHYIKKNNNNNNNKTKQTKPNKTKNPQTKPKPKKNNINS